MNMAKVKPTKKKAGVSSKTILVKSSKASVKPARTRQLKQPKYKSFKLSKRIKIKGSPLPSAYNLMKQSYGLIKANYRLFLGIVLIYGLLSIVLVRGFGSLSLTDLKNSLQNGTDANLSTLSAATTLFSYLLSTAGSAASATGGVYQSLLAVLVSLVIIWGLRQAIAGIKIGARDAYYNGTYPFVPFILVLAVVALQLIPLALGGWLYSTIVSGGIAAGIFEQLLVIFISFLFVVLSLYMITSSLFALYVVTLPNTSPMKALRTTRQLVLHRRWLILRKILALPLILFVIGMVVMIPFLIFLTPVAEWAFFGLSIMVPLIIHSYMYLLYRSLL